MSEQSKYILIAEDDEANFKFLEIILNIAKYNTMRAENGLEAFNIARTQHIDLILMDMRMPEMDGLEATSNIRQFNKSVPIIAQTAYTTENDKFLALEVGCNDFITKPIDKAQLLETIKKYLKDV